MFLRNVILAATALLIWSPVSNAQSITPSHVYQVVDQVNAELTLLFAADLATPPKSAGEPEKAKRNPGHVISKAREALMKVQTLRYVNGLILKTVKTSPVRKIVPADVKGIVDQLLVDVRELRPAYKITQKAPDIALKPGKSPTDVYNNLSISLAMIDALNIPKTAPNDVYRAALSIVDDIIKIRAGSGVKARVRKPAKSKGKKPADAYNQGYAILVSVKKLGATSSKLAALSKIVLPTRKTKKISPAAVLELLNNVSAELLPFKMMVGANKPSKIAKPQSGKTPSDVFDITAYAQALVDDLGKRVATN